jgi:class 3 adenylate cyclase/tetratricopeptide (TPR) repeat protein
MWRAASLTTASFRLRFRDHGANRRRGDLVVCSSCGSTNPPGIKFCEECGQRLSATCPSCGSAVSPNAKFCGECGTPMAAAAARPAAGAGASPVFAPATAAPVAPTAAHQAERRLVSVLFADLVGFTPFAEERDAEEVRETLSAYFDLARDLVARYGGTVEKFIGDAVMAVWGAPTAREDDAERAVRAGLELIDAVRSLGPTIQARAGVLTGEAAVTIGAIGEGMVAGDLVNTAARLQSVAAPGTVLVGESTYRAADRAIAFEPAGDQTLKGKAAPVPAWRAVRVVAERGGRNRAETLEAPFVGRDDDLRLLKELFHATQRDRKTRLVSVVGPAGIGKTRLAWEFLKYVDGLLDGIWWHQGRSPAYGEGITFWALGEMVRGRCGLLEADDEATTRAKVAETVRAHVPDETERRWIEPALLTLLGVGGKAVGSEQLFAAWRTFFERLAAEQPVVMVFEDMHYADSGLLDFIDHLLSWSRNVPIYVLTLARPELLERRSDWHAKRNLTSAYLEPLSDAAMRELLAGLVPGLPERAVGTIVSRADGIPLYAVETVRMLLADGKLELRGGVYAPVGDLTEVAVPETLTALIASRLDALPAEDRALVQDAAVLGQSFTLGALADVSGLPAAELEPRLRVLVRRELLALEADPRSPERGQYAFVQALIREVAYNTLAKKDRKTRHLAAARYFEGLGSDELAGALAGHYLAAWRNSPEGPEADALAAQARIALRAAADRASALGANEQVVMFTEQALTVTTDSVEQAELLERAGEAASYAAHHEAAIGFLRQAVERYRVIADRTGIARSTTGLARVLNGTYRTDEAKALLEPAIDELVDLGDDPAYIGLVGQLARTFVIGEEHRLAVETADRALAAAERLDLVPLVVEVLAAKGSSLVNLGHTYEGLSCLRGAIELADANGFTARAIQARISLAAAMGSRDPAAAVATGRTLIEDARRLGLRSRALISAGNAAEAARSTGDWDWALIELDGWLASDLEGQDRSWLLALATSFHAWRGEPTAEARAELDRLFSGVETLASSTDVLDLHGMIALGEGRLDSVRAAMHEIATLSPLNAPGAHPVAGRAAIWGRDPEAAKEDLDLLEATGARGPFIELRKQCIRAGIAALEGRTAEARAGYADVLRAFEERGARFELALVAIDMATVLDPTLPDVRVAIEQARAILVELRARPFLDRLEALAAGRDAIGSPAARPEAVSESAEPAAEGSAETSSRTV